MSRSRMDAGYTLIELMVYVAIVALVLGLASAAYVGGLQYTSDLSSDANEIMRAVKAGEIWRADVRLATKSPRLVDDALHISQGSENVIYDCMQGSVVRKTQNEENWIIILRGVDESIFVRDARDHVISWRWEVTLPQRDRTRKKEFSFTAVPVHGISKD